MRGGGRRDGRIDEGELGYSIDLVVGIGSDQALYAQYLRN